MPAIRRTKLKESSVFSEVFKLPILPGYRNRGEKVLKESGNYGASRNYTFTIAGHKIYGRKNFRRYGHVTYRKNANRSSGWCYSGYCRNNHVTVKGPKGTLERTLPSEMDIKLEGDEIIVTRPNDLKKMKSLHGLTRTLINNMVVGVTNGYTKELEVNGVGYRASKAGKVLTLNLGYSHPVEMEDPEGLESKVDGK